MGVSRVNRTVAGSAGEEEFFDGAVAVEVAGGTNAIGECVGRSAIGIDASAEDDAASVEDDTGSVEDDTSADDSSLDASADSRTLDAVARFLERQHWLVKSIAVE